MKKLFVAGLLLTTLPAYGEDGTGMGSQLTGQTQVQAPIATDLVKTYRGQNGDPVFAPLSRFGIVTQQTGTTYTLTANDCQTEVALTNAATITVTIPASLPVGCNVSLLQAGAGTVTVTGTAVAAATLHSRAAFTGTAGQWAIIGINIEAAGIAILTGDGA